ncbi:hypothetical protein [Thiomonas sp. X19]|uniref:hypothetical protein n=1 Tax=Thiomonas sp. X19 TaxID=1050370 RepID=UPI0013141079|nr:hypothetical protein [Thiomonas sp. X19]
MTIGVPSQCADCTYEASRSVLGLLYQASPDWRVAFCLVMQLAALPLFASLAATHAKPRPTPNHRLQLHAVWLLISGKARPGLRAQGDGFADTLPAKLHRADDSYPMRAPAAHPVVTGSGRSHASSHSTFMPVAD